MKKSTVKVVIKSIMLLSLVIGSIYQTAMLWFDYPSDRNFFYSMIDNSVVGPNIVEETNYKLFFPEKLAIYLGNLGVYSVRSLYQSENLNLVNDGLKIIQKALETETYMEDAGDFNDFWVKPHVLFELPFTFDAALIKEDLKIDSPWIKEGMSFDRVYIYPASDSEDGLVVYFTSDNLENVIGCKILKEEDKLLNDALNLYIGSAEKEGGLTYISTKMSPDVFLNQVFVNDELLPTNGQAFDLLENLYSDMFFYTNGERESEEIETFVKYFFLNPENTWSNENEREVRYGDMDAVTKYTNKGLFEYKIIKELVNNQTTVNDSYKVVETFLEKDTLLGSIEYSLDHFIKSEAGVTFYYNYGYRNVPIIFEDLRTTYGMDYPMEITVVGNTVINYRRLLWKSEDVVLQGNPFEVRFQTPIDTLLERNPDVALEIEDITLGYHVKDISDGAYLQWIVVIEEATKYLELE